MLLPLQWLRLSGAKCFLSFNKARDVYITIIYIYKHIQAYIQRFDIKR